MPSPEAAIVTQSMSKVRSGQSGEGFEENIAVQKSTLIHELDSLAKDCHCWLVSGSDYPPSKTPWTRLERHMTTTIRSIKDWRRWLDEDYVSEDEVERECPGGLTRVLMEDMPFLQSPLGERILDAVNSTMEWLELKGYWPLQPVQPQCPKKSRIGRRKRNGAEKEE